MRENPRLAVFAVMATASSGFGQTFFFSVFGSGIRETFQLPNSTYGLLYSIATLTSAALLLKLGALADRWALPKVTLFALLVLAAGCLTLGLAPHWLVLTLGFLLTRLGGQGLMGHIGFTVAGRYFARQRGRIMALTSGGLPLGEAVLPLVAGLMLAAGGWRQPWLLAAGVLVLVILPVMLWLARHAAHPAVLESHPDSSRGGANSSADFTRGDVLRDPGFYRILPAALATPFTVTAVLFHQSAIAELRGWSAERIGVAFTGFAAGHVMALLLGGPLVDRIGAQRALAIGLIPVATGMLALASLESVWTPNIYLTLTGTSLGFIGAAGGAIWPERYGVRHLGAIRAMAQSCMVFSTALSPILIGVLLDWGVTTTGIGSILAAGIVLSGLLVLTTGAPRPRTS